MDLYWKLRFSKKRKIVKKINLVFVCCHDTRPFLLLQLFCCYGGEKNTRHFSRTLLFFLIIYNIRDSFWRELVSNQPFHCPVWILSLSSLFSEIQYYETWNGYTKKNVFVEETLWPFHATLLSTTIRRDVNVGKAGVLWSRKLVGVEQIGNKRRCTFFKRQKRIALGTGRKERAITRTM